MMDNSKIWEKYDGRLAVVDETAVRRFQEQLGIRFPGDYINCLVANAGKSLEDGWEVLASTIGQSTGMMLGFLPGCVDNPIEFSGTVPYWHQIMSQDFSDRFVPIMGGVGGGDIVLDYRLSSESPSVNFIHPESFGEDAVVAVASSFSSFLDSLVWVE